MTTGLFVQEFTGSDFESIFSGRKCVLTHPLKSEWEHAKIGDLISIISDKYVEYVTWKTMKTLTSKQLIKSGYGSNFFVVKVVKVDIHSTDSHAPNITMHLHVCTPVEVVNVCSPIV
jgi:hypothetical protein